MYGRTAFEVREGSRWVNLFMYEVKEFLVIGGLWTVVIASSSTYGKGLGSSGIPTW